MSKFFDELKRRNVLKETIAYLVVAWLILQIVAVVMPIWNTPDWVLQVITITLALGLPLWILFSWNYEISTSGIKKTTTTSTNQPKNKKLSTRLNILIMVAITGIIALIWIKPDIVTSKVSPINLTIAVLPFDNMSSDKENEWFCDGVTNDILTYLSKVKGLRVISRTSVMQFKNSDKTVPEIAAELGASYIVEGSVRKNNNKVLISAQLIKANDEYMWSDNYNESLDNVFQVQQDVARKIVEQLKISISPEEEVELAKFPTENFEAYRLVSQGRSYIDRLNNNDDKGRAVKLFKQAIKLDPNYAEAFAELAWATQFYNDPDMTKDEEKELAQQYLNKSLEIDSNCTRAISIKGYLFYLKNDFEAAKTYMERALKINPSDARAHQIMSAYYNWVKTTSNIEKAVYHIRKAHDLDPFSALINRNLIVTLLDNKQIEEAELFFEENTSLFSQRDLDFLNRYFIRTKIEVYPKRMKDLTLAIKIIENTIEEYPEQKAHFTQLLGLAYGGIYNDLESFLKYTKEAYTIDSSYYNGIVNYHKALTENKQFEKAKELMDTENFKNVIGNTKKLSSIQQYYYYHKGDYQKAKEIIEDSLLFYKRSSLDSIFPNRSYDRKAFTYAQLGERKKVKEFFDANILTPIEKAFVFAIFKERDSMYYYLNHEDNTLNNVQLANRRSEFDLYRKEPRYIEFLKNYYFPISEQKIGIEYKTSYFKQ